MYKHAQARDTTKVAAMMLTSCAPPVLSTAGQDHSGDARAQELADDDCLTFVKAFDEKWDGAVGNVHDQ